MSLFHRAPADAPTFVQDAGDGSDVYAVIETPSGSRTKYAWSPERGAFGVRKVLPLGTTFPYDFGFIAGTKAADGDPLDVLVLADEPLAIGSLVQCRVLGAVACTTSEPGGEQVRNDRVIAVPEASIVGAEWRAIGDIGARLIKEITDFLASYTSREGRQFILHDVVGRDAALELVRAAV
jgi:inorganic pyrophosphatase